ncbi:hypothetical protein [Fodinibius sediminis]|nr:hypothetical protein [Fodinibius sediminis]
MFENAGKVQYRGTVFLLSLFRAACKLKRTAVEAALSMQYCVEYVQKSN